MYCTRCGHPLSDQDRFCSQCGAPVGGGTPWPAFTSASGKRLVRPMAKKSIAGVCAGFADYLDVDITLMRILWLCAAIFTGVGFIAYLVCWIVMPKDDSPLPAAAPASPNVAESTAPAEGPPGGPERPPSPDPATSSPSA